MPERQAFKQQSGQAASAVRHGHDIDLVRIVSVDDSPRFHDEFPVDQNIRGFQLGNDPAPLWQPFKRRNAPFRRPYTGRATGQMNNA